MNDLIAPGQAGLDEGSARALLTLSFNDRAQGRLRQLLEANNRGTLDESGRAELEKYLRVGQFLDLMQAKARLSLARKGAA